MKWRRLEENVKRKKAKNYSKENKFTSSWWYLSRFLLLLLFFHSTKSVFYFIFIYFIFSLHFTMNTMYWWLFLCVIWAIMYDPFFVCCPERIFSSSRNFSSYQLEWAAKKENWTLKKWKMFRFFNPRAVQKRRRNDSKNVIAKKIDRRTEFSLAFCRWLACNMIE